MWTILFGSLAVLALVTLLLMPIRLVLSWSGGLVQSGLRFLGISYRMWERDLFAQTARQEEGERRDTTKGKGDGLLILAENLLSMIDHRDTLMEAVRAILKLAGESRKWWRFEQGRIDVAFGIGSPALTGMAHGALAALGGILTSRWPQLTVSSNPDFQRWTFASSGELIFRARAWDVLWHVLCLVATIPWRNLWKMKRDLAYS
jgi:hypothetical protein